MPDMTIVCLEQGGRAELNTVEKLCVVSSRRRRQCSLTGEFQPSEIKVRRKHGAPEEVHCLITKLYGGGDPI